MAETPESEVGWAECELPGHPICSWHLKRGQSCGTEPLAWGVCTNPRSWCQNRVELFDAQSILESWKIAIENP